MMWSNTRRIARRPVMIVFGVVLACVAAACSGSDPSTPGGPSNPSTPTVVSVAVTGTDAFTQIGATAQFTATVTLSNGTSENRTTTASWQSDNPAIATVSPQGLVTVVSGGQTTIAATVSNVRGTRAISVARRTPDPAPGQQLPLPDVGAFIEQAAAARPELIAQSCPNGIKYVNNPWLDYMVDQLRTLDTRWGYNAKPTRTAADNNGVPVVAAGDEIAYHFGSGFDEGTTNVYLIDILEQHCGSTPKLTYRHFTGEELGRWTGAGRF